MYVEQVVEKLKELGISQQEIENALKTISEKYRGKEEDKDLWVATRLRIYFKPRIRRIQSAREYKLAVIAILNKTDWNEIARRTAQKQGLPDDVYPPNWAKAGEKIPNEKDLSITLLAVDLDDKITKVVNYKPTNEDENFSIGEVIKVKGNQIERQATLEINAITLHKTGEKIDNIKEIAQLDMFKDLSEYAGQMKTTPGSYKFSGIVSSIRPVKNGEKVIVSVSAENLQEQELTNLMSDTDLEVLLYLDPQQVKFKEMDKVYVIARTSPESYKPDEGTIFTTPDVVFSLSEFSEPEKVNSIEEVRI